MLVSEIITQAGILSDVTEMPGESFWMRFINAALDDLTPVAKMLKMVSTSVVITSGRGSIPLTGINAHVALRSAFEILHTYLTHPPGTTRPLRRLPISDYMNEGWKLTVDELLVNVGGAPNITGTVVVDYYDSIPHVATVNDTVGLPLRYHHLVVLYCCAKAQQKEEELNDKNDFFAEYLRGRNEMAMDRIWEMEPHNRKNIEMLRVAAKTGIDVRQ